MPTERYETVVENVANLLKQIQIFKNAPTFLSSSGYEEKNKKTKMPRTQNFQLFEVSNLPLDMCSSRK